MDVPHLRYLRLSGVLHRRIMRWRIGDTRNILGISAKIVGGGNYYGAMVVIYRYRGVWC